jgi:tRNA nucleotidyltransferase (CCA-adding enzyme)
MVKLYLIGGAVRDHLMGKTPKDFDFSVVAESYDVMREWINENNFEIFLETPQYLTIRARRMEPWIFAGFDMSGMTFDFVLARQDGAYSDGRRPDEVTPGTIFDDLARRDFTMNAVAIDTNGSIIDPFGGQKDIAASVIRCVGGVERLHEDGLRMMRAIRFAVQLDFMLDGEIIEMMSDPSSVDHIVNVSTDRIRDELEKALRISTMETLYWLRNFHWLGWYIFEEAGLWLKPTSAKK